jgi:glycosyltransferase involved in cell wall biosynthesis
MSKTLWALGNNEEAACLVDLWEELEARKENFYLANTPTALKQKIKEKKWGKIFFPSLFLAHKKTLKAVIILVWPLLVLFGFFYLWLLKKQRRITKIIFLTAADFSFWAWPARLAGIRIAWLVTKPLKKINWPARVTEKLWHCPILVFNELTAEKLRTAGFSNQTIKTITPGINLSRIRRQENIFSHLAEADDKYNRKFFVVGTVLTADKLRLETLLAASRACLYAIPNLQIIIVGDMSDRKKSIWLAEKMGLETIVWFVGRQKSLNKYFSHFDIYTPVCGLAGLPEINLVLLAQASGVPVVCPEGVGLEEIIKDNKTGLILAGEENEKLTQAIIKLKQNLFLRRRLSQTAREHIRKNHSVTTMINNFQQFF